MSQAWTYKDFVKDALSRVPEISAEELSRAEARHHVVLLDVRESDEMTDGTLEGAVRLPRGLLEKNVHEHVTKRDTPVVLYCATGNRSALAGDVMLRMGFTNVRSLAGGIERWRHLGLPVSGGAVVCRLPGAKLNWDDVRHEFAIVARCVPVLGSGERNLVYMDHAASTHAPASVLTAYTEFVAREYANIHRGTHHLSRKATERFEECYYIIADYLRAELRRGAICFTNNTTQAIDLCSHVMADRPGKVVTTEMEHHSNELPHRRRGPTLRARVTDEGELDLDHLEELLRKNDVKLVAVTAGSNVTGVMPDLRKIARMAHENGALILVDAAQALARMPIDVRDPDDVEHIDFLAGAGHKAYAPFGAGFLYGPRALMSQAPPYLPGGGTASKVTPRDAEYLPAPDRHHGGTPNIAGVVGMARALSFLQAIGMEEVRAHEVRLMERLLKGLQEMGGITLYGPPDASKRLGVATFNVDGVSDLLAAAVLSEEGAIAVRNGRFCSHLYMDKLLSAKAKAAGQTTPPTGAVRASVGLYNDESDVDRLLEYVQRVRDRKWRGHYQVKGDAVSAEFAGRCADKWMESTQESNTTQPDGDIHGYEFEVLQPDGACRSYLIADKDSGEAMLVDPLREHVDHYLDLLKSKRLRLRYTLETHTHADHLSGSMRLKELTGALMLMHSAATPPCVDKRLQDGDTLELGTLRIEVMGTPGHTEDALCLVLPGRVLTGDTLLIGACGRTDLPSGSSAKLYESLQRLMALPEDTVVLPSHDYQGQRASTIGREKRTNPRLQVPNAQAFAEMMAARKLPPPQKLREALDANQNCR
ncbi:aminotransferase class V-fold PLP-dependent enzyme [Archangium sp.]|jgi:selenocysteine lyase/cysteine desulfurase/glyoxylase-like metal-dependent hydrolase (beta-lactamase superfamily II)/rhodanese-related sulfurtransferase|uniref:aminotransferase class V-fold PLP-dependent enzyme n=1 Tax=Archangium sp. TaxID=1872627 RepID=UPI002EDB186E